MNNVSGSGLRYFERFLTTMEAVGGRDHKLLHQSSAKRYCRWHQQQDQRPQAALLWNHDYDASIPTTLSRSRRIPPLRAMRHKIWRAPRESLKIPYSPQITKLHLNSNHNRIGHHVPIWTGYRMLSQQILSMVNVRSILIRVDYCPLSQQQFIATILALGIGYGLCTSLYFI